MSKLQRKLVRQRIHNRNLALAQTVAEQRRPEWERVGYQQGYRQHQSETTRIIGWPSRRNGADRDAYLLCEPPKDRLTLVALDADRSVNFLDYQRDGHRFVQAHLRMARFEPVRKCWTDERGNLVVWFDYEFRGVS